MERKILELIKKISDDFPDLTADPHIDSVQNEYILALWSMLKDLRAFKADLERGLTHIFPNT